MKKRIFLLFCFVFLLTSFSYAEGFANLKARKAPEWIVNGIMYQINMRAFTPEGTIAAAEKKIPDLKKIGVTIIYICPIFVADDDMNQKFWSNRQKKSGMNNPRNPYRMKDYFNVDPEYGTNDDLKKFIQTAHQHKMRVMLDLVFYHCGPTALCLSLNPEFVNRNKKGEIVYGPWLYPTLNFKSKALRDYLYSNIEYWVINFNVDGYRVDVADMIPLDFWEDSRRKIEKIRPDIAFLAEGMNAKSQLTAYDLNYNFTFNNKPFGQVMTGTKPVSLLRSIDEKQRKYWPQGSRFIRYIDNHDISNDDYDTRRETKWTFDGINAAFVLIYSLDGVPFIYNGQEVADKNRHSIFGKLPINWSNAGTEEGKSRTEFLNKLGAMRNENKTLVHGSVAWVDNEAPDKLLSFTRKSDKETINILINLSREPITAWADFKKIPQTTILSKGSFTNKSEAGKPVFELPAFGYILYK